MFALRHVAQVGLLLALVAGLLGCNAPPGPRRDVQGSPPAPTITSTPPAPETPATPSVPAPATAAIPTSPPAVLPPGLAGTVAYLDNDCWLSTVNLATGERQTLPEPVAEPGDGVPACGMTEADVRFWLGIAPTPAPVSTPPRGLVRGPEGQVAWIDPMADGARLYIRMQPTSPVRDYPLDGPPDLYFGLIAYVAEGRLLLSSSWFPSSGTMTDGGYLVLLDPQTGAATELGIRAHAQPETLALNASQSDYIAVAPSAVDVRTGMGECALLVIQLDADALSCVEREPASVPIWSPDGQALAYSTLDGQLKLVSLRALGSPPATLLSSPEQVAPIAWVDVAHLLYVVYHGPPNATMARDANRAGELRLLDVRSGVSTPVATGVAEPRCFPICAYLSLVAFLQP